MTELRVLILGLDGATWRVLRPLLEAGELPHLAGSAPLLYPAPDGPRLDQFPDRGQRWQTRHL